MHTLSPSFPTNFQTLTGTLLQFKLRQKSFDFSNTDPTPYEQDLTLLTAAVYINCIPVARRLPEKGISPAESSKLLGKPCVAAAVRGNDEILKMFLEREWEREKEVDGLAQIKRSALRGAIEGGHVSTPSWYLIRDGVLSGYQIGMAKLKEGGRMIHSKAVSSTAEKRIRKWRCMTALQNFWEHSKEFKQIQPSL
jgi:hypothetical protein